MDRILQALDNIGYGLYIVTSQNEGKLNGLVVNTVIQVTLEPPRVSLCIHKNSLTREYIAASRRFAVSVLDESTPVKFTALFGYKSGRDVDKLSEVNYRLGRTGCPLVTENAVCVFEAEVFGEMDVGTHVIFAADVVDAELLTEGKPMSYRYYRTAKKAKASKQAPTYRPPSTPGQK